MCVCVYVCVVWERLGGPIRPTTLIPLAASSCHVVSALGLFFVPFGLSGNVSAGVPSHPPHPIACSHVPKAPIMAIGPDGRRHYEPAMRTCPTNPPPGARPPGTTWHQMLASVWRWDCRPIRLVDRVPHLFLPVPAASRPRRHQPWLAGPWRIPAPSPLRDVCISSNTPERCDGPSGKGNPAKRPGFALARKTRSRRGRGCGERGAGSGPLMRCGCPGQVPVDSGADVGKVPDNEALFPRPEDMRRRASPGQGPPRPIDVKAPAVEARKVTQRWHPYPSGEQVLEAVGVEGRRRWGGLEGLDWWFSSWRRCHVPLPHVGVMPRAWRPCSAAQRDALEASR